MSLLVVTIASTLGSLELNNDGWSSSNSTAGPEDEWLPGPNPWVFDSASNPILEPPDLLEWILGDPAVIQLGDQIHMFANEVNTMYCISMKIIKYYLNTYLIFVTGGAGVKSSFRCNIFQIKRAKLVILLFLGVFLGIFRCKI